MSYYMRDGISPNGDACGPMGKPEMASVDCAAPGGLSFLQTGGLPDSSTEGFSSYNPMQTQQELMNQRSLSRQLDGCLSRILEQRGFCIGGAMPTENCGTGPGYAEGGLANDYKYCFCAGWEKSLKEFSKPPEFGCAEGKTIQPLELPGHDRIRLKALRQLMDYISPLGNITALAKGGLPPHYHEATPRGHNPEFVTGHTGYYADGRGTGQSDDIPALLHDGDYVMDAETVSALGDGSSKAGREVLDKFRHQIPHSHAVGGRVVPAQIADGEYVFPASFVSALGGGDNKRGASILDGLREKLRAHKRAAPVNKIPPKAKSPLEYISKAKG